MQKFTKILSFLVLTAVVVGGVWYFYSEYQPLSVDDFTEDVVNLRDTAEKQVIAPGTLEGPTDKEPTSNLTVDGILQETNRHRQANGLSSLSFNSKLAEAARIKAADMFARQYFAHESPTGEGPADLAEQVDYDYIMVGENLALGNYETDAVLVQAWMDSPGHRANILHSDYDEIGISVLQGTYEGNKVWMAVQEFGRPASDCTAPDTALSAQIDANKAEMDRLEPEIEQKREELEESRRGPGYGQTREEYNELVRRYNALVEETKKLVSAYNSQVQEYNLCLQ